MGMCLTRVEVAAAFAFFRYCVTRRTVKVARAVRVLALSHDSRKSNRKTTHCCWRSGEAGLYCAYIPRPQPCDSLASLARTIRPVITAFR